MEIIMDQHKQIKSIERVKEAEEKARLILDDAKRHRERKLREAGERARKMVEDAEIRANSMAEELLKKTERELELARKRKLEAAKGEARKISSRKIGKDKLEALADKVISEIMGA